MADYRKAPESYSLLDVIQVLIRWWKYIVGVTLGVALLAAVVSLVALDNYYQATTTFYALNPEAFSPEQLAGESVSDLNFYGDGDDVDRILSIAMSGGMVTYMIDRFDLYTHYDIDTSMVKAPAKVRERFGKLYQVLKNERDAIELSIEDKDPALAAEMANTAREHINTVARQLIERSQREVLTAVSQGLQQKETLLADLRDSIKRVRARYNVIDPESQGEMLTSTLLRARSGLSAEQARLSSLKAAGGVRRDTLRAIESRIRAYQKQVDDLTDPNGAYSIVRYNQGFGEVVSLTTQQEIASEAIAKERRRYGRLQTAFAGNFPAIEVQDVAEVPVVKSRPRRSIYVLGAMVVGFVVSVLGVLLFDSYRDLRWSDLTGDTTRRPSARPVERRAAREPVES